METGQSPTPIPPDPVSFPQGSEGPRTKEQARMLTNRIKKRHQHLRKWARREHIEAFRLYDKDIPEIPLQIDIYGKYLHIAELLKFKDKTAQEQEAWTMSMADATSRALGVPIENVFVKSRRQKKGRSQYEKFAKDGFITDVHEGGLVFQVNLSDYIDTGLFLDHRITRSFVRDIAEGSRMLNLFSYTGSFSVYAAHGGAMTTTSVDLSNTYSAWAERNLEQNGFITGNLHKTVSADVMPWLTRAAELGNQYDLIVCDPPTFSNSKKMDGVFDVQKDHPALLTACLKILSRQGVVIFSNNFRKFKLHERGLPKGSLIDEITNKTIPEDFSRRKPHRCWMIRRT